MTKSLVVVESPAKCRTITKYLGKDFDVKATMGHIIDLPEKELGVDVDNDFKPKYIVSRNKSKTIKELKESAKKVDVIYLAPDPDREGEAIAWHVAETLKDINSNIKRVQFNEITKKAVLAAIENAHDIDTNKVNAQQARRILDRIVGYQVSPVLWKTVFKGLSAGRVQSVALRIICEREDEISVFEKVEYWSLLAELEHDGFMFNGKLLKVDGNKADLPNEETTKAVIDRIKGKPFVVTDVVRNEKQRKPYAPFITSTLQQDAARKLGFSAAKSMMIAQQLYEGLELGKLGTLGLITYMRTDSTRISDDATTAARETIIELYDDSYLPKEPRQYGKSKNAQDAHEAIRPSQVSLEFEPDAIKKYLTAEQYKLYKLIWKRFLASQMNNAIFDSTRIDITVEECVFRATGQVLKFDGFLSLYDESKEEKSADNSEGKNDRLPPLSKDTTIICKKLIDKQHFTQPPPRYTEASLVKELESKGIGRPSTYAQIIDTLKRRKYVELESKRFTPTEVGLLVRKILVREFESVFNVTFTASMESDLDKIEEGNSNWIETLKLFYNPFNDRLQDVKKDIKSIKEENQEVTDKDCPECKEHKLVVKWSKNGKFLACQGFPKCRYTEPLNEEEPETTDEICDKCGAPMVILKVRNSRFLGCSTYPKCKNAKSLPTGVNCPEKDCGGALIERSTKRGKVFFGCSHYPKCSYASWNRPLAKECPSCAYPVLVLKETKAKGQFEYCTNCKSEYQILESEEVTEEV